MAGAREGMASLQDKADEIRKDLVKRGVLPADSAAASLASAVPTFSKGTRAIDQGTGEPIEVPPFTDGGVAVPATEGGEIHGAAPPSDAAATNGVAKTPQQMVDEHQARIAESGGAVPADNGSGGPPARPTHGDTPAEAPPASGAAAAEAAAEAIADAFAEYEEFEFDDPTSNMKYPVRVPKKFAQSANAGMDSRAALDRAIS